MQVKSRHIPKIIMAITIIMLFNSLTALAGIQVGKDKLKFNVVFDIFNESKSINGGSQITELEVTGDDISVGGVLQSDTINATVNTGNIFIMEAGFTDEEKEIIKKNNCEKDYYIDMEMVQKVYKEGLVKYIGHSGNKIKFIIDGKILLQKYEDGKTTVRENIYFTLDNKIVVKNDAQCVIKEPDEPPVENINEKRESYYIKRENILDADVLYIKSSDKDSPKLDGNIYSSNLKESRVPSYTFNSGDIEEYLDLKKNPIFKEELRYYFENNERKENSFQFNLVGYEISAQGKKYTTFISEKEYALIELIGIDKFVYLKSKNDSVLMDYPENKNYSFDYSYNQAKDLIGLDYRGNQNSLPEIDSNLVSYIDKLIGKLGGNLLITNKGLEISNLDVKKKIIGELINESIGSNIISEIVRGEYIYERDKNNNELTKLELNDKYEKIRTDINKKRLETNNYLTSIENIKYEPISTGQMGIRAFGLRLDEGDTLLEKNNLNQMNYRYDKVKKYYNEEMLDDLMVQRTENRDTSIEESKKIKSIMDKIIDNEKNKLKLSADNTVLKDKIIRETTNISAKKKNEGYYNYFDELNKLLNVEEASLENPNLSNLEIEDISNVKKDLPTIGTMDSVKKSIIRLDTEIDMITNSSRVLDKFKKLADEEALKVIGKLSNMEIEGLEGLNKIKTVADFKSSIIDKINVFGQEIKTDYEQLEHLDNQFSQMTEEINQNIDKSTNDHEELEGKKVDGKEDVKNQISKLITEKQLIVRNINKLRRDKYDQEWKIRRLESELVGLQYNLILSKAEVSRIQSIIDNLTDEKDKNYYEKELNYASRFVTSDEIRVSDKESELREARAGLEATEKKLLDEEAKKQTEFDRIDGEIKTQENILNGKIIELKNILNSVNNENALLGKVDKNIEKKYLEILDFQNQIKEKNRELNILNSEISNTKYEFNDKDKLIESENNFIYDELKQKKRQVEIIEEVANNNSLILSLKEDIENLEAKLENDDSLGILEEALKILKETLKVLEGELLELEKKPEENAEIIETKKLAIKDKKVEILDKEKEIKSKIDDIEKTKSDIELKKAQVEDKIKDVERLKIEIEKIEKAAYKIENYREKERDLLDLENSLQVKLETIKSKNVSIAHKEEEVRRLNMEIPKNEIRIKELEEEIKLLKNEILTLEEEINGSGTDKGLLKEIKELKTEIYVESQLILESEEKIEKIKKEQAEVQNRLDDKSDELDKLNQAIVKLESQILANINYINAATLNNENMISNNSSSIDRQKDLIDKEKELTENLKETIRAVGDRKRLEVDNLNGFATSFGKLEFYKEEIENGKINYADKESEIELLLGEIELKTDFFKTYKFQKDRYDYGYIYERLENDKAEVIKPLENRSKDIANQEMALKKARYEHFNLSNDSTVEELRKLDIDKHKLSDTDMLDIIASLKVKLEEYKQMEAGEKDYSGLKSAIKKIRNLQDLINRTNSNLAKYTNSSSNNTAFKYEKLGLGQIGIIETEISKTNNIDIENVENQIAGLGNDFNIYMNSFNQELNDLKIIKQDIEKFKVKKSGTEILFNTAIDEIGGLKSEMATKLSDLRSIDNLFSASGRSNPLSNGVLQHGATFRLLYKISENNEESKENDLQEYTVNIPWVKVEADKTVEGMDSLNQDYVNVGIEHVAGLFNKGKHTLTGSQRESVYYIFNPTINPDGSFSLLNYDGNRPMEFKIPKSTKLIVTDENIRKYIEDKKSYENSSEFHLKLAYIQIDDEIIWRDELKDEKLEKNGDFFKLSGGKLNIYHNKLQKENEELVLEYKQTRDENKKIEILGKINSNLENIKSDNKVPRVKFIFEDDLNIQYLIKYTDNMGNNILDPVKIKSLAGLKFDLDGPKFIVNEMGDKFQLIGPTKYTVDSNMDSNGKYPMKTYEFKYKKIGRTELDEEFDIPGYEITQIKKPGNRINYNMIKLQENTKIEKDDKNNQSNFKLEKQKDLNIRFINVDICSINNCKVHTGEQRGTRLGSEVVGWFHSKMYIPDDKSLELNLKPYLEKYASGIWSYGIEETERGVKYPIKLPENKLLTIDKDFGSESNQIYVNLYNVSYLPHYPDGGTGETKKYFEYTIDHKYFNRELEEDSDGDYVPYENVKGDYSINLKYDMGILSSVMTMDFTNFIYKYWEQYKPYVMRTDTENRSFDKLIIKNINYNKVPIKDENGGIIREDIEEVVVAEQDLVHNPTLDKGVYKYSEVKDINGKLLKNIYEVNFLTTTYKSLMESDWYEYSGFENSSNDRRTINLYKELNARSEKTRKTTFEYYFTGNPIWTPEVVKTKVIEEHVDIMTGHVFNSIEYETYVDDTIKIVKPDETNWPENYRYIYTSPDVEKFSAKKGDNRITHYYINKDYLEIKYLSNGGKFGDGNPKDITNIEKTERIVIGKLDELLSAYHPKDIYRTGHKFTGWAEKTVADGKDIYTPVDKDKLVSNGLELYAQWEKVKEPIIIFHSNGGKFTDNTTIKTIIASVGSRISSYEPGVSRDGYNLTGWTLNSDGGESALDRVLQTEETVNVYAQWKERSTGGGGGDKGDPKPKLPVVIPPVEPEKDRKGREIGKILEPKIEYELNKQDHFAYIKGYKDNTVKPNGDITREEVAMVFYRLMEKEHRDKIETSDHNFNDIKNQTWSTKAIATLSKGGVLKGYEDGSFKAQNKMTRGEISKVIARFTDTIVLETQMPDIIDHWAEDYINTVENKGWVKGYEDGSFKPNEHLTRGEFVTMMNSLLDRKVGKDNILSGIKTFKDLEPMRWYYEQMVEALNGHDYELERLKDDSEIWIKLVETQYPD